MRVGFSREFGQQCVPNGNLHRRNRSVATWPSDSRVLLDSDSGYRSGIGPYEHWSFEGSAPLGINTEHISLPNRNHAGAMMCMPRPHLGAFIKLLSVVNGVVVLL